MSEAKPETRSGAFGVDISRRQVLGASAVIAAAGMGAGRAIASPRFDRRRWYLHDYRIVQTNLREIDALKEPAEIARSVSQFGANVIVSNIGGIVAFYPTDLKYHYRNPYLEGDFVGEMLDAAHSQNMAYLGRFDLSKGMKPAFDAHPEWFARKRDGSPREFNGTYQACPSGQWMQEYGIEILREALSRYQPDGVFFNGVYFPTINFYNGVQEGNCACDNCRRAFRAMYNRDLPKTDNASDPAWYDYRMFQRRTLDALQAKIDAATAPLLRGAPIMGREIVGRGEVQRGVRRPAPEWPYQAGEYARMYMAEFPGKPWSATSASFMDFPWRKVTETADYHKLRFAQVMGTGGHLDLYLMGTLADQVEPTWLKPVSDLFKWRAANTQVYDSMALNARVGLYHSLASRAFLVSTEGAATMPSPAQQLGALRGAYITLVDSRIPFQMVADTRVADGTARLSDRFDVLYLPNTMTLTPREAVAIDKFVSEGGLLIATGLTASHDAAGKPLAQVPLACLPTATYGPRAAAEGWSLDTGRGDLEVTGHVPIDGFYYGGTLRDGVANLIPFAPEQRYGPPELNYPKPGVPVRTLAGIAVRAHGKGHAVHVPWHIDWLYYRDGMPVLQQVIAALIEKYAARQRFVLTGIGPVELMQMGRSGGQSLLHVINYAGQRNGRYDPPPYLSGLRLGAEGRSGPARALVSGQLLRGRKEVGRTWYDLPPLGAFEAILI